MSGICCGRNPCVALRLFAQAGFLASRGDARAELYANVERLRSEAETMSFVDLSRFRGAIGIERVVVILSIEVFARAGTLPQ